MNNEMFVTDEGVHDFLPVKVSIGEEPYTDCVELLTTKNHIVLAPADALHLLEWLQFHKSRLEEAKALRMEDDRALRAFVGDESAS